jgi:hypothetical protein
MTEDQKKTPMGAYAFMAPPWSPYQVANNILVELREGVLDRDFLHQHHLDWSGLSEKEIDAIFQTLDAVRMDAEDRAAASART